VADNPRIEDLRRRVQKDPASIAFAQLAEELRRAGEHQEAVDACRAGLATHPGYLSARVTLGRALLELDQLDEAQAELEVVLASASENLAAIRGLAEIFHRRGSLAEALKHYRTALALAPNDPDLERTVTDLSRAIEPKPPAPVFDGLSFEQLANEFMMNSPPPPPPAAIVPVVEPVPVVEAAPVSETDSVVEASPPAWEGEGSDTVSDPESGTLPDSAVAADAPSGHNGTALDFSLVGVDTLIPLLHASPEETASPSGSIGRETDVPAVVLSESPLAAAEDAALTDEDAAPSVEGATRAHAHATIAALDQWLDAIHVARADRRA